MSIVGGRTYIYACQGVTKENAEQIQLILDRIVKEGLDPSAVTKKLNELPRTTNANFEITQKQKIDLVKCANLASGAKARIVYLDSDPNAAKVAAALTGILVEAGWAGLDGRPLGPAATYTSDQSISGIRVEINRDDYSANKYPAGAIPLSFTLRAMKLGGLLAIDEEVPPGTIQLRIGKQ